jgi:hypothetical protein
LPVTFGVGTHAAVDEAIVEWPGGARETIGPLRAGRAYVVTEGKGVGSERPLASPGATR